MLYSGVHFRQSDSSKHHPLPPLLRPHDNLAAQGTQEEEGEGVIVVGPGPWQRVLPFRGEYVLSLCPHHGHC